MVSTLKLVTVKLVWISPLKILKLECSEGPFRYYIRAIYFTNTYWENISYLSKKLLLEMKFYVVTKILAQPLETSLTFF